MTHQQIHAALTDKLNQIADCFNCEVNITLIVRIPYAADGGLYLSDDDPDKVIASIRKMTARVPDVQGRGK